MGTTPGCLYSLPVLMVGLAGLAGCAAARDAGSPAEQPRVSAAWQNRAVQHARLLSRVTWTPVADGMPIRGGGHFVKGKQYTGVPYSSVKSVGRYIGFDISLKTFLAAAENPRSVLYTRDLTGKVSNAAAFYGAVCSSYTSYALQCGIWYVSRRHGPPFRKGVILVTPQSAQAAEVGDIIYTPPAPGSHVELVTEVTRNEDGTVTHVMVEDSWPPTTRTLRRDAAAFDAHIAARGRVLYRITGLDAWREGNRSDCFVFPSYDGDSVTPVINRVVLLDLGDWVPYKRGRLVRINVMDRDSQGVEALVIRRGGAMVEEIDLSGPEVIERSFPSCGDYTAHCEMTDGSLSQACEFAVCDLGFAALPDTVIVNEPWEIGFRSENMRVIMVYLASEKNGYARHSVFVTDDDRRLGRVVVPAELVQDAGRWQVWLIGEHRLGRLKQRRDIDAVE